MGNSLRQKSQAADVAERTIWTMIQGASGAALVAGYQALEGVPDIPSSWVPLAVILVAGLLAFLKSVLAQRMGNGTAATLPTELEPIPNPGPTPVV